jgi:single-stranded-DNA-specific exonuclease
MDHAETALRALICSDTQVGALLDELENLNTERKGSTAHFVEEALKSVDPMGAGVIYRSDEIDHGVIGLVAGRLAERLGKPAIACLQGIRVPQKPKPEGLPSESDDTGTQILGLSNEVPPDTVFVFGSMRSPANYDLTAGLDRIAGLRSDIFVAYGGHAQAAGFTIYPEQFESFCALWQADIASYRITEDLTDG